MRRLDASSVLAQAIYRTEDGSEWATLEQAENYEKRVRLISDKLSEMGGLGKAYRQVATNPELRDGFAWRYLKDDYVNAGRMSDLAKDMDEIVALAALLKPILDECGSNPYPLNY